VHRLRIPLAGEGDDLFLAEGRDRAELDDLAFGEVFEVEDGRRLRWLSTGGWTLTLWHLMRRIVILLSVLAALGAFSGCGDEEVPPLTADEFASQANAICKDSDAEVEEKKKGILPVTSAEQLAEFTLKTTVPSVRDTFEDIDKLRPPKKEEEKITKMLEAGNKALDIAEEELKDKARAVAFLEQGTEEYKELRKQFNEAARDLKLNECADPT
jgi:hypothetical protein